MSVDGSITQLLGPLKAGDEQAVRRLWAVYFERLVRLARAKLGGRAGGRDEEDAALSAFDGFCRAVTAGRFPDLFDRDDLWQILLVMTARKTANLRKHENALKRQAGRAVSLSADAGPLAVLIDREPDPAAVAETAEQVRTLLDRLEDAGLRAVAVGKMEGYTNQEIAAQLGRSVGSVERKLRTIRALWTRDLPP